VEAIALVIHPLWRAIWNGT